MTINELIYQYPGNNYFPENIALIPITLFLIKLGLWLSVEKNSIYHQASNELIFFMVVMSVIAFASNAIQLTPFPPIDSKIIFLESMLDVHLTTLMEWTNSLPAFKRVLIYVYDSLPYQMSLLPLTLIVAGRFTTLKEYYFLILVTALLGFTLYYFFPTIAPASSIQSPLFSQGQFATGIKFNEIHHHQYPSTIDGGLIAFPSFHVIWALLCLYLVKDWPILLTILSINNSLLIASCVLLGWHYPTDVIASLIVVFLSYLLMSRYRDLLQSHAKNDNLNHLPINEVAVK